jgi:hypothetical protein
MGEQKDELVELMAFLCSSRHHQGNNCTGEEKRAFLIHERSSNAKKQK